MTGVIGSVGRFKQGIDLANQQEILKKASIYKQQTKDKNYSPYTVSDNK